MFTTFSLAIILDCTVRIVLGTALGALIGGSNASCAPEVLGVRWDVEHITTSD